MDIPAATQVNTFDSAPGWYYDQDDATLLRFWDGHAWTDLTRPRPPA